MYELAMWIFFFLVGRLVVARIHSIYEDIEYFINARKRVQKDDCYLTRKRYRTAKKRLPNELVNGICFTLFLIAIELLILTQV